MEHLSNAVLIVTLKMKDNESNVHNNKKRSVIDILILLLQVPVSLLYHTNSAQIFNVHFAADGRRRPSRRRQSNYFSIRPMVTGSFVGVGI